MVPPQAWTSLRSHTESSGRHDSDAAHRVCARWLPINLLNGHALRNNLYPPPVPLLAEDKAQEDECHKHEQQHYQDRDDDHHIWVLGSGLWGGRARGHRSPLVPGARLRGQLSYRPQPPTPGQPAVTLHCRGQWKRCYHWRKDRSGPAAGLYETMSVDGLQTVPCTLPDLMVCSVAGVQARSPPWAEIEELWPNPEDKGDLLTI